MVYLIDTGPPARSFLLATNFSPSASSSSSVGPDGVDGGSTSPLTILLMADEELQRHAAIADLASAAAAHFAASSLAVPVRPGATVAAPQVCAPAKDRVAHPKPALPKQQCPGAKLTAPVAIGVLGGLPKGYLPGVTGAKVGLLPGLRTEDMLEYYGVSWGGGE